MKLISSLAFAAVASGAIQKSFNGELIEGEFIVVFHDNVTDVDRLSHMQHGMLGGAKVMATYNHALKGYAVSHSEEAMAKISEDPNVAWVEQNQVARAIVEDDEDSCGSRPAPAHWGLRRVSSENNRGSADLKYSSSQGAGIDVYVIDTGIATDHVDFGGRAAFGFDCTGEGPGDKNGHGTHCAGTVGGNTHGVASKANLFAVKVLNGRGSGSFACVIQGIDWVGGRSGPRVGSLSLGGGFSAAVNSAVDGAVSRGAAMSSASGNSNANACNFSPASAKLGVSVNSIQDGDRRSSFSNYGTCTDIFAPGTNILSTWIGSNTATRSISGTSMACPHVSGVIAETWSANPSMTGEQAQRAVVEAGALGKVSNAGSGSPNVLAQTTCA